MSTARLSSELPHEHHLVRTLGLVDVVMIGIAGMIGGAIFVLVGPAIGLAGSAVINAFISGWMAWFAHIVAGSLYAVGYGSFQFSLLNMLGIVGDEPLFGFIHVNKLIALLSIAAFAYVNIKGASETGKLGIIVTVIQLGTIFALIGAGFLTMNNNPDWTSNFMANFAPIGIGGIVAAMGLTFIAFEGYEIIVQTGEEVKKPRKNIPRAIFISLTLVVLLYCLVALVSIGAISPNDTGGIPVWNFIGQYGDLGISKAAEIFLPYGSFIILAGGIVSSLAALNATTYSSARVAFAMGRHYNLPHQLSNIHHKFKTPYLATIISAIIMAVMAYALPLDQIALAAGVIFLLLFTQVNIAVITIRRIHGDRLQYGFKIPFFPIIPIVGIFLKLGLAIYLLFTHPTSWLISVLWIAIGFAVYRIYTFRKEIEHYAPIVTSEGDLARKHFRILIPYTPENPDRLTKYAVRVAKENDGEINILRVITVPHQTPLSAGTAFTERAAKDFEPLEKIIDKENILNHYFVRISHEANEAILSTIEEQRIDLLIMDYETLSRNKALQTLATCNMLAILTGGISDEELALEDSIADRRNRKKSLVVLYDGGDHSDMVLKTASWLEHSGKFKTTILSIKKKEEGKHIGYSRIDNQDIRYKKDKEKERHVKYLEQIGVEFREVFVTDLIRNNSQEFCQLILSSINASQPDMLVAGKRIGKFSVFDNEYFVSLLERLNCPVIVARSFVIPGLSKMRSSLMKAIYHR